MAAIVVVASACSGDDGRAHPYATQSAAIGESLSVLGWHILVTNLRFDAEYVLVDVDATASQKDGPHAKPEDIRFGLYGALAHPIEANGLGACKDVTSLALQPLSAPTPDRLTGTVCLGPQRDQSQVRGIYVYSPRERIPDTTAAYPAAFPAGNSKQLAIARALATKPKVLLLDEPTEGIQPSIIKDMARTLKRIRDERGLSIVVSEQVLSFALDIADRVLVIENGEIVRDDARETVDAAQISKYLSV